VFASTTNLYRQGMYWIYYWIYNLYVKLVLSASAANAGNLPASEHMANSVRSINACPCNVIARCQSNWVSSVPDPTSSCRFSLPRARLLDETIHRTLYYYRQKAECGRVGIVFKALCDHSDVHKYSGSRFVTGGDNPCMNWQATPAHGGSSAEWLKRSVRCIGR
jgi:hypothetical protein